MESRFDAFESQYDFVTSYDVSCSILKKYSALLAVSKSFTELHSPGKWASHVEEMVKKSAKLRRCLVIRLRCFKCSQGLNVRKFKV